MTFIGSVAMDSYPSTGIGNFKFENKVEFCPLKLHSYMSHWIDPGLSSKCKVCNAKGTNRFCSIQLQWGETEKYERISEVCETCLLRVNASVQNRKSDFAMEQWLAKYHG